MSDKQVCFLSSVHPTFDTRIFEKEAKTLSEAGYEVCFCTPHEKSEERDGVRIVPFSMPNTRVERFALAWRMGIAASRGEFDVYHLHDPELLPVGVMLELTTDAMVVYDVHENYELALRSKQWIPEPLRPLSSAVIDAIEGPLARRLSGVIAASADIAHRFDHHPNVATVTNYPRRKWARRPADPLRERPYRVVYVGTLSERRGVLSLIDGVSHLAEEYDLRLIIGGAYTNDRIKRAVNKRLARYEWLDFRGWLSTDEWLSLFRMADVGGICIHPTDHNLSHGAYRSNKLFQYMSTGLPVIAPDMGNWPEIIERENCGVLVDTEHPASIASGLETLLRNHKQARQLGANGRRAVLEQYNWETQAEALLDFYRRL